MIETCTCDLCVREREWEETTGTCYRCCHDIPCAIAESNGEPCATVLDRMSLIQKD
ncbi:MAG: hypothetical protein AB7L09_02045 [Nitrospira sp.]